MKKRKVVEHAVPLVLESKSAAGRPKGLKAGQLLLDDKADTVNQRLSERVSCTALAKELGVARMTLYNWIQSSPLVFPEFKKAGGGVSVKKCSELDQHADEIFRLVSERLPYEQIANRFFVSRMTLFTWLKKQRNDRG